MLNLVRRYKLDQLEPILTMEEKEIISYIKYKLSDLLPFSHEGSIAYMNMNGECILYRHGKEKRICIRNEIYLELHYKYNMMDSEIDETMEYFIQIYFNNKIRYSEKLQEILLLRLIIDAFAIEVINVYFLNDSYFSKIEEVYNEYIDKRYKMKIPFKKFIKNERG